MAATLESDYSMNLQAIFTRYQVNGTTGAQSVDQFQSMLIQVFQIRADES